MASLRARLLLSATIVLAGFLALCGLALERAFREAAVEAERDRLQGLVFALLGVAELSAEQTLFVNEVDLPDPRLKTPQSGLEAAILNAAGEVVWQSSSLTVGMSLPPAPEVGTWEFGELDAPRRFTAAFGVRWLGEGVEALPFTIVAYEDTLAFTQQLGRFRATLWTALLLTAGALLAAQLLTLIWGLSPLRRLVHEIHAIEAGAQAAIHSRYPQELQPLTGALNAMIHSERAQLVRYRNALGDLAHTLKTPLAVLHGVLEEPGFPPGSRERLRELAQRMQSITDHQLQKAATAGRRALSEPVLLRPLADKIASALQKVYADKALRAEVRVPERLRLRADEGDLYEVVGNLMDNAAKWSKQRIRLSAAAQAGATTLTIEDDGPGFPPDAERLMERGARADMQKPGQGLGLAAVRDIVVALEGELKLSKSELGGARVDVTLRLNF